MTDDPRIRTVSPNGTIDGVPVVHANGGRPVAPGIRAMTGRPILGDPYPPVARSPRQRQRDELAAQRWTCAVTGEDVSGLTLSVRLARPTEYMLATAERIMLSAIHPAATVRVGEQVWAKVVMEDSHGARA